MAQAQKEVLGVGKQGGWRGHREDPYNKGKGAWRKNRQVLIVET
jgi:hypothetical protein